MTNFAHTPTFERFHRLLFSPVSQVAIALVLLISVSLIIYWPGLNSAFQLDDYPNLEKLNALKNSDTATRLLHFIASGHSGPGGRPISLASFLIDDYTWPSDPRSFKYTNLMIHLINGVLIFLLTLRLLPLLPGSFASQKNKHIIAAGLCAMLWTFHPFQTTTVLYVIQRMTELSATFILLGVIAYLYWRRQIDEKPLGSYLKLTLAIGICGILSVLSKENGVLLFLYLLILEKVILQRSRPVTHPHWKKWIGLVIIMPNAVILGYLAVRFEQITAGYQFRDFTLWQRLLTEARVISEYLYHILLPKIGGNGLYHDDYVVSHGLLDPPSTLVAVIGMIALFVAGLKLKQRLPLVSFAILWFFASHVLESTFLPLELYFEHRNYVAIFGVCLLAVVYVMNVTGKIKPVANVATALALLLLAGFTRLDASFWGKPEFAAFIWAQEHPKSIRATQDAAIVAFNHNQVEIAKKFIRDSLGHYPDNSGLLLEALILDCIEGKYQDSTIDSYAKALKSAKYTPFAIRFVRNMSGRLPLKECPNFSMDKLAHITEALIANPKFNRSSDQFALYYLLGKIAVANRDLNAAMTNLDKCSEHQQNAQVPLDQTKLLISAGLFEDAFRYVKLARQYDENATSVFQRRIHQEEISVLYDFLQSWTQQHPKNRATQQKEKG